MEKIKQGVQAFLIVAVWTTGKVWPIFLRDSDCLIPIFI